MHIAKLITRLMIPAAGLALAACQTLDAPKAAHLLGRVDADRAIRGPFVVAVVHRDSQRIAHRVFLERAGEFDMLIEQGKYKFVAFADLDRDGQLGAGEPVSVRLSLQPAVRAGDVLELPALHVRTAQVVASLKGGNDP